MKLAAIVAYAKDNVDKATIGITALTPYSIMSNIILKIE